MKKINYLQAAALVCVLSMGLSSVEAATEQYQIDPTHSFITFSIAHLGYSLLQGRFNKLEGNFSLDTEQSESGSIHVKIDTASIDSNHAERDKHLRSEKFLSVKKFPQAEFISKRIVEVDGTALVKGVLTLHGVTNHITFEAKLVGAGADPWGGFRRGYSGSLRIKRSDFGINSDLGATAEEMDLGLFIEGIRQ